MPALSKQRRLWGTKWSNKYLFFPAFFYYCRLPTVKAICIRQIAKPDWSKLMMTDAMNLQQRNVEYERQRHLANWLIESSPHMPKASPQYQQQQNKKQKKLFTTSIFHDSFFFLSKSQSTAQQPPQIAQTPPQTLNEQISTNNISNSKTPVFTSQTNLPLQIVQSSRDGNKPKLRRFNSHDTSANMFSVAEFENARLARRNELELVRQKNRYKMNSLSSGCDSSTGDSKGSKFSNEVIAEEVSFWSNRNRFMVIGSIFLFF